MNEVSLHHLGSSISSKLREKLVALYDYFGDPNMVIDDPYTEWAFNAMRADWEGAFSEADSRIMNNYFTQDEWYALYASQNGVARSAGMPGCLKYEVQDYFFYAKEGCADDHPLLYDADGQKRLIEKLASLTYFDEVVVFYHIKKWWQKF